jgi:hypothetical protein
VGIVRTWNLVFGAGMKRAIPPFITEHGSWDARPGIIPAGWVWLRKTEYGGGWSAEGIECYEALVGFDFVAAIGCRSAWDAPFTKPAHYRPRFDGVLVRAGDVATLLQSSNMAGRLPAKV